MNPERSILVDYVRSGRLMQFATIGERGEPAMCHVWYRAAFAPDRLWFISRADRRHSRNIRQRPEVAGGIVAQVPDGLGETVRGVTFQGRAVELPTRGIDAEIEGFVNRWPAAADALNPERLADGQTSTRMYEIAVDTWVLFDEMNFPDDPRREMSAAGS